jgi:uncharacterized protein (TIGR02996 family)
MTPREAFYEAIRDEPTDDTPRLVFADWLDDQGEEDRAEFIRLQCQRARMSDPLCAEAMAVRAKAEQLLQRHWQEWVVPLARLLGRYSPVWWQAGFHPYALEDFDRGFITYLSIQTPCWLDCWQEIQRLTPLSELQLSRAGGLGQQLADCPGLAGLTSLQFGDYWVAPLGAADLTHLAGCKYLNRLRALHLYRNNAGDEGVEALARSAWLAGLTSLHLGENGLSARAAQALATAQGFRPVRLWLGNNFLGDEGAEALIASALLERTERLMLGYCGLSIRTARALADARHLHALRVLDLFGNRLTAAGVRLLDQAPWRNRVRILTRLE